MLAATYRGQGRVQLQEHPAPEVRAHDDVLVRVLGTGVCGTDRAILRGLFAARPGVVLGHEAIGVVEAVGGGVAELRPGDSVIVNPTLFCGRCSYCLRGRTGLCRAKAGTEVGVDRDGTFAEQVVLPERFLFRVPAALSMQRAVLVEPLACVLNNLAAAQAKATDYVVVLGGGPIGALAAMVARRACRAVSVVEADPFRAQLCAELAGHVLGPPAEADGWARLGEALPLGRPDLIIDTTGVLLGEAVQLVADGGSVVAMGFNTVAAANVRNHDLVARSIRLLGAGDYDASIFPRAIDLAIQMPLERLVTHRVPLREFDRVKQLLALNDGSGQHFAAMKVVVEQ